MKENLGWLIVGILLGLLTIASFIAEWLGIAIRWATVFWVVFIVPYKA